MTLALLLTLTVAVSLVSAHPVEKRQFRDLFRNLTAAGTDALSDLFDFASSTWDDLRTRLQDYDISNRLESIRDKVRARYGSHIDSITNLQFDDIAKAAKDVIDDARDLLDIDDIVGRIRKSLGSEVDDVSDAGISQIVQGVEDDVAQKDDDAARRKRGVLDDLRAAIRNVTSDLFDRAGKAWRKLRQRIRNYDIRGRLANLRQRVRARVGDIYDSLDDTTFGDIAKAARDTIEDAAGAIGLDSLVKRIRNRLRKEVDDVSDVEIKEIVQAVEDDVADADDLDDDDDDENDGGRRKRGVLDDIRAAIRNITSAGLDALSSLAGLRDAVSDLGDAGRDTLTSVISLAERSWATLRQRVQDYDARSRLAAIQQRIQARFGDQVERLSDLVMEEIAVASRDIIKDSVEMLEVSEIVQLVRSSLGSVLEAVSDTQIGQVVQGLEDDVSADSDEDDTDDGGMRKRGLRDDLRHVVGNLTSLARDTLSDLIDLARLGWKNLQQRLHDYNIPAHLADIRRKIRDRWGSFIDQVNDSHLERIAEAARDVIENTASLLDVDAIVEEIRSRLGQDIAHISDDEIADIVLTLEDDVSYEAETDDVDRSP